MAYIDQTYYTTNGGKAEDYTSALATRVSELIDKITFRAVERYDLRDTKLFENVQRACVTQMLFIASLGGQESWEADEQYHAESMGNYSYTRGEKGRQSHDGLALAPSFLAILNPVIALGRKIG